MPDGEKVVQGQVRLFLRGFYLDDTITCMSMHPVEATTIRSDAYVLWNGYELAIYVDCKVYMNVIGVLCSITVYAIYGWVGCIVGRFCLDVQESKSHYTE